MWLRFAVSQGLALLDRAGTIIVGSPGNGALFVFLTAYIGGFIGVLGGAIGNGARISIARYKAREANA